MKSLLLTDLVTIFLGFLEGFTLIISPCIWSILPIVLAGSLVGSKKRALGLIVGFALTFVFAAFFAKQFVELIGVNLDFLRQLAYGLLFVIALILLSDVLSRQFAKITQWSYFPQYFTKPKSGFWNGVLMGVLVAFIWTPCAGPILAAIIVQVVIQKTTFTSFVTLFAFALGATLPMLLLVFYGFKIKDNFAFFKKHAVQIRKALGLIILVNLIYMISVEQGLFPYATVKKSAIRTATYLEKGLWRPYSAPGIAGIETWLNSPPLRLSDLKGKVVLIDFWTYSCINCIRTLPYLTAWYKQYHPHGLEIIGIHSPEFAFEKKTENVEAALKRYGILYPVALDNSFVTWRLFGNHYWPAHYLINSEGVVVYEHFGEGDYDVMENNIRFLLGIDQMKTKQIMKIKDTNTLGYFVNLSPETYLGYGRADSVLSPYLQHDTIANYDYPKELKPNAWALSGSWEVSVDKITTAKPQANLQMHFHAGKVYAVMSNKTSKPIAVHILLNGKAYKKPIMVDHDALYELLVLPKISTGILELRPQSAGLEIYTLTFGS